MLQDNQPEDREHHLPLLMSGYESMWQLDLAQDIPDLGTQHPFVVLGSASDSNRRVILVPSGNATTWTIGSICSRIRRSSHLLV